MNQIRSIERLNQRELEAGISIEASWHQEYKDTAYIFFGSLPYELTEGDILVIFSQYGVPVHLKLVRDKETGKSKGFGWLKYEDQRSTILAVDNLSGAKVLGRSIRVDHAFYEDKENDEEYEEILKEALRKDFASDHEKTEEEVKKADDDEFQDPLLLMQASEKKDKGKEKREHRSHRDREHRSHRSKDDDKERRRRDDKDRDERDRRHERHREHHHKERHNDKERS